MLLRLRVWLWSEASALMWRIHDRSGIAAYRAGDRRYTLTNRALDRRYGLDDGGPF